jgi:hypothetical protein
MPLSFRFASLSWTILLAWPSYFAMRHPHPKMVPRFISGHFMFSCGHSFFAKPHISVAIPTLHKSRMCSMFSVAPHSVHKPLLWKPSILNHTSPIMGVLCIALYSSRRQIWKHVAESSRLAFLMVFATVRKLRLLCEAYVLEYN